MVLKNFSKGLGNLVGDVISGSGNLVSKGVEKVGFEKTADFIGETAGMVGKASSAGIATTGQVAEGIYKTAKGQIQKDTDERTDGVDELKDAGGRVIRGIGSAIKMGAKNTYETGAGLVTKDYDRAKGGARNLAQLGIVMLTAVSVIDLMDGPDAVTAQEIQSMNMGLVGDVHPITGVPFELSTVEFDGQLVEGAFPVFNSAFETELPGSLYLTTDSMHFRFANVQLAEAIEHQPSLAAELHLTPQQVEDLHNNVTPEGYVWHHHEQPGVLQLVEEDVHNTTAHTGGRFIWGGGSEYR